MRELLLLCTLGMALWSLVEARVVYPSNNRNKQPAPKVQTHHVRLNLTAHRNTHKLREKEDPSIKHQSTQQKSTDLSPYVSATKVDRVGKMMVLMQSMSLQMQGLRNQLVSLKYQNHLVYKQLKKLQNYCSGKAGRPKLSCPKDYMWVPSLKTCYRFRDDRITWRMARERCKRDNADLVSIESSREQHFITNYALGHSRLQHCNFWTGATDEKHEGEWRWVGTGNALSYANWNHNEPNNANSNEHCMHMLWIFKWAWNDARCHVDNACYICEARKS